MHLQVHATVVEELGTGKGTVRQRKVWMLFAISAEDGATIQKIALAGKRAARAKVEKTIREKARVVREARAKVGEEQLHGQKAGRDQVRSKEKERAKERAAARVVSMNSAEEIGTVGVKIGGVRVGRTMADSIHSPSSQRER